MIAVGIAGIAVIGFPLFELVREALGEGWSGIVDGFDSGGAGSLWNTVWTGSLATVCAVGVAAALAVVVERRPLRSRNALRVALVMPLLVPPFVAALAWAQAFGPGGLIDDVLGWSWDGVFGPAGVVAVLVVNAIPLAYVVVAAGLATGVPVEFEHAARASGATPREVATTVTLPLLKPALAAAAGLVFVTSINAFGVPMLLGVPAGFETMTTRIYQDLNLSASPDAFTRVLVLATALVCMAALAVGLADRSGGLRAVRTAPAPFAGGPIRAPRWGPAAVWVLTVFTTLLPLLALVLTALTRAVGLNPVPSNWTTSNFAEAVSGPAGVALGRSLALALISATIAVGLGALVAGLVSRGRKRLGTMVVLTFAVPGSALAVAVLLAYGSVLRDTVAIILVAYTAKFWALGHRPIAGSAASLPPDLVRASRVSGAGPFGSVRTVVVPLLRPAILAAWALVFLFAFHELTMSSLLYGPGSETLAVVILNLRQIGDITVTSAMAVTLTGFLVVGALPLVAARRMAARWRGAQ